MIRILHSTFYSAARLMLLSGCAMMVFTTQADGPQVKTTKNSSKRPVAITENVIIHSPEHENSTKTIARKGVLVWFEDAVATILVAHGYMCNKYDVAFLRNLFPYGKFNFLTFDFRAHGENIEGQTCTLGRDEPLDVIAAANFIKNHSKLRDKVTGKPLPLYAYAFSMGAVSSIQAHAKYAQTQQHNLFDAMILDCPFDSTENILKKCVDNIKFSLFGYEFNVPGRSILQKYAFHPYVQSIIKMLLRTVTNMDPRKVETTVYPVHPVKSIAKVTVPCFFIHCKKDEKVSISAIKEIYAQAAGPKMLWITNGRNHYDSFFYNPELYVERVRSFLDEVLAGKWKYPHEQQILEDVDDMQKA